MDVSGTTARPSLNARASREAAGLIVVATVVCFVWYYFARADALAVANPVRAWSQMTGPTVGSTLHFLLSAVLLGVIPLLAARWMTGSSPRALGLSLGDRRLGAIVFVGGLPLGLLAGWIGSREATLRAVYPLDPQLTLAPGDLLLHAALQFLYFVPWEILFRGVLLFGLAERLGPAAANAIQTALSVMVHFGRPMTETLSAIPAGLVFGWVDLRLRSIWPIALVHWLHGVSLNWFILQRGAWPAI